MKLEVFFDFSSPWAYLGFESVHSLGREMNLELRFRPVLVGGIFNSVNQSIYHVRKHVPAKMAWLEKDLKDWSEITGIVIKYPPPVFPVNSAKALRACLILEENSQLIPFIRSVFQSYWEAGSDISKDEVLLDICHSVGIDAGEVMHKLGSDELREKLRSNVDEAIIRGGFGVPTFFLDGDDMYFGVDRLPIMRELLVGRRRRLEPSFVIKSD